MFVGCASTLPTNLQIPTTSLRASAASVAISLRNVILDAVFPEFCLLCGEEGVVLCSRCTDELPLQVLHGCPFCDSVSMRGITCEVCGVKTPLSGVFSFGLYNHPRLRELIIAMKYHHKRDLAGILGVRVAPLLQSEVLDLLRPRSEASKLEQYQYSSSEPSESRSNRIILTAVPLHPSRLKERGYNQSELLARAIAERLGFHYENLLERTRPTTPQVEIQGVKERQENVRNAFCINSGLSPKLVEGQHIILTDDVVTTGATLSAGARVLKRTGAASVFGLALARG